MDLRPRKYNHSGYNYVISASEFIFSTNISNKNVNQSRYRPGGAQEVKVSRLHDNGTGRW